jgi:hypothetical protein
MESNTTIKHRYIQGELFPEMVIKPEDIKRANGMVKSLLINNSTIIKNVSFDQKEILFNIMSLYLDGNPFECDITASTKNFYKKTASSKYIIPEPKLLMDVYPQSPDIIKITPFEKLPVEDGSIHSIIFDPPFVISPKTCKSAMSKKDGTCLIANRFSSFYPVMELYENYYWWAKVCYDALDDGGVFVVKTQSNVSGGYKHNTEEWMFMCCLHFGFYCIDKFTLEAKARLISSGKYKKQQHARNYLSTFYVFKKDTKMHDRFDYFKMLERMDDEGLQGKVWSIK